MFIIMYLFLQIVIEYREKERAIITTLSVQSVTTARAQCKKQQIE